MDIQPNMNPAVSMTDFESAEISAIQSLLPSCEQKGCLRHLGQAIWRKNRDNGYGQDFTQDHHVRFGFKFNCSQVWPRRAGLK